MADTVAPIPRAASTSSYAQILKSTALIGGSTVVSIAFAVIRNKAIAVLLGPGGIGLMGLYNSISDLANTLAGIGIQASGVRQIAEANGTGDADRIARTATVLRRVSVVLAIVGAVMLVALSAPIAAFTFGDHAHAAGVALLSVALSCRLLSSAQMALIQGMRRIADIARIEVFAAMFGTLLGVPLIYVFREDGIVPALISIAAVTLATSWWYSRNIRITPPPMTARMVSHEAGELLQLGFVFMVSGFLTVGAAYAVRIIVLRTVGFEAVGHYQAAWSIGGLYAGFILQAMGTDFYPRLTAVATDDAACNRLVNEQAHVSILLAGPGLLATLTLAPLLITALYSAEFHPAADLLRWLCLGMMLRIVAWPMGFIVLAKGARRIFFWTEVAATLIHVGLAWLLIPFWGIEGAGIAFVGLYLWHTALIYALGRRLSGFRWSRANVLLGLLFVPIAAGVFWGFLYLPQCPAMALGAVATLATGIFSLSRLLRLFPAGTAAALAGRWLPGASGSNRADPRKTGEGP